MEKHTLEKQLIDQISKGNFERALDLLPLSGELPKVLRSALSDAAYDPNLAAYAFTLFLLTKDELPSNHEKASYIVSTDINYLVGAYEASAHHARKAFESATQDNPLVGAIALVALYVLPEQPISKSEAVDVAEKILIVDPENYFAQEALRVAALRTDEPIAPLRNDREQLELLIREGLLTKAKEFMPAVTKRELHQILLYLGCEERNLCAYTFTWVLMQAQEDAELDYIAYRIVTQAWIPLDMKGCYATAAFHLRRAMHLDPTNVKYAEHFLMLHTPPQHPTHLIDDDEAEAVARNALSLKADTYPHPADWVLQKLGKAE